MVFKPINLARSSLVKTFTHGYAQSLFAASQSSSPFPSTNTSYHTRGNNVSNYFGKVPSAFSSQNAHQTSSATVAGTGAASKASQPDAAVTESGLAAYYAAWQKHQKSGERDDKDWPQFQFAKRIGWKAPTTIPEPSRQQPSIAPRDDVPSGTRGPLVRTHSATTAEDIRKADKQVEIQSSVTIEQVEEIVQKEIQDFRDEVRSTSTTGTTVDRAASSLGEVPPTFSSSSDTPLTYFSNPTLATDEVACPSKHTFSEQLAAFAEKKDYVQIPPVFQTMLEAGIKPTASAYNALLLAAINLAKNKHHIVPKVLDVFSDLKRRDVQPNTSTYAILIQVLAARSIDVVTSRQSLSSTKQRLTVNGEDHFLFNSDAAEYAIVVHEDTISAALRLFDASSAFGSTHIFPPETYRLLIVACANSGRLNDLMRIYSDMEGQKITPPSAIFAPMIRAFAHNDDLQSSIKCYEEYKELAIAHNNGVNSIDRRDPEVYAALVEAYNMCNRPTGALKFLSKLEDVLADAPQLPRIRELVAMHGLAPFWTKEGKIEKVLQYAETKLDASARSNVVAKVCIDAADQHDEQAAIEAFRHVPSSCTSEAIASSTAAMLAMHIRSGDLDRAQQAWHSLLTTSAVPALVDSAAFYAVAVLNTEYAAQALNEIRGLFDRIRFSAVSLESRHSTTTRIGEAVQLVALKLLHRGPAATSATSAEVLSMMVENESFSNSIAASLLAGLRPDQMLHLLPPQLNAILEAQSAVILAVNSGDASHAARIYHLLDLITSGGYLVTSHVADLVEQVLARIPESEIVSRWRINQSTLTQQLTVPRYSASLPSPPAFDDSFDPYTPSTDFKGSAIIAEELDKTSGRHAMHLNEALIRFKNMRRAGRHPRYIVYAKLITAAGKENRMNLVEEILALAHQDVPYVAESRVVRHGWFGILDSMVGACLIMGKRELAARFHNDLLDMGTAPSANTFGLYITTLKESVKTSDEATEAVKIFHRAQSEGVVPTSFLYNALIGKLGKARRIDDCLFHFAAMRAAGIRPTSVTYGTLVNALCRVSDDAFAEQLFAEMEAMPNYKPRVAPYNCIMQHFLQRQDKAKVLAYHARMRARGISPSSHTFKVLLDAHTTLQPVDNAAADALLAAIPPADRDATQYGALIHARGCVQHDFTAARAFFDSVMAERPVAPAPPLFQALFESYAVAHAFSHDVIDPLRRAMRDHRVPLTPYIANTLIHGWALAGDVTAARAAYDELGREAREPSTYEAMVRALVGVGAAVQAEAVVREALGRGYPRAVEARIEEVLGYRT